jgi:TRAP-type uncharacterized transport system substrate-binding protein
MSPSSEARLDRPVTVHMMGDWGIANLHRICGWLSAELWRRTPPGSRFAVWNGRGGADAIEAVLDGAVQTALMTPAPFARSFFAGKAPLTRPDMGRLRALGTLPQDDRLVLAVDAGLGIHTFAELRDRKPALRIGTAWDDGVNMVGWAAHRVLAAHGIPKATIEAWGGALLEGEAPWDAIGFAQRGEANAVLFEAIMTPFWKDLLARHPMSFLPFEDAALAALERDYGWPRGTVPADRFAGVAAPFQALDFSDFVLLCRDDFADDLGYVIASILCETRDTIEVQYRHMPPRDSPLTYPLEPRKIARTAVPLNDGARRYYQQQGLLD